MEKLIVSNLTHAFGSQIVLEGISFTVNEGELIAITGPSGVGKTTLLNLITGLIPIQDGSILRRFECPTYLFAENRLIMHKNALINVALAHTDRSQSYARELLKQLGLEGEDVLKPVGELSFGMARRVAIARAMAHAGDFLILDEPIYGLDAATQQMVVDALKGYLFGKTGIIVTHEQKLSKVLCNREVTLK